MARKIKILIVTAYFYPEDFKVNDIAFYLNKEEFEVTVITSIPNYPEGKFKDGYGFFKKRRETLNDVNIIRIPVIARGKGKGLQLFLNYISFVINSSIYIIFYSITHKFDKIFVHEPSPITVGIPAIIYKKIRKTPIFFWVLDLWPESLTAAGGIKNKSILKIIDFLVKIIYKNCDMILISSRGFKNSIVSKGNFSSKIKYFPNWAEAFFENDNSESTLPCVLPNGFKIMYAGNIGESQNLEQILNCAYELRNKSDIKWIVIGDGRKRKWVEDFIKEKKIEKTVFILGRFPIETMPSFFKAADAMLISLKDDLLFSITVPGRLQSFLASGKPILGLISGETANIINEANCGLIASPSSIHDFKENIVTLYNMTPQERKILGANGLRYYKANFAREKILSQFELLLKEK